ncbi:hypothetical protein [Nocardioides lijunqiniae]|uniref:hypothetical protein n=1 Tax=Nocardioides lijunqiniae TaxID=2760832 RepID=UPI001877B645|nr:hypothetical protein [Nocardioides lijunqiniae]
MTAPKHARDVKGKGRYYGSCGDDCPFGDDLFISVTNAQGVVAKPALVPAAVKVTAETAWNQLPAMVAMSRQTPTGPNGCEKKRVAERCGSCRFCLTAAIKREHQNQWDTAADFGSLVHSYAFSHVVGEPRPYDPDVEPFVQQYIQFLSLWGVDLDRHVEAAETTVLNRPKKYAGTGDIWLHLPTGPAGRRQLWLVDIKTSLKAPVNRVYADQELQLAGLRFAPTALLADDTEIAVPKFAGAALLNLRAGAHQLIPLPADKAAYKAFLGAVDLQLHFHAQDTKAWVALDAPALPAPARKAS